MGVQVCCCWGAVWRAACLEGGSSWSVGALGGGADGSAASASADAHEPDEREHGAQGGA